MNLGRPSRIKDPRQCFEIELPVECCNDTLVPIKLTCEQIVEKAYAGHPGVRFPNSLLTVNPDEHVPSCVEVCAVQDGTIIRNDDGSECRVRCDDASVVVFPWNETNGIAISGGSDPFQLGGGPRDCGKSISKDGCVVIQPGGGFSGKVCISTVVIVCDLQIAGIPLTIGGVPLINYIPANP